MQLRRIETAEQKKKKDSKRNLIFGLLLIIVMVLSTWGYAVNQEKQQETLKYKDFIFVRAENGWSLQKPFALLTSFNPREVESIPCSLRMQKDAFANQDVYVIAANSDEKNAANEIIRNLPVQRVQLVCFEGEENKTGCEELPLKNCYDHKIIVVKELRDENSTAAPRAYQQNNCLFVESGSDNLTMAADRALFSLYGVI